MAAAHAGTDRPTDAEEEFKRAVKLNAKTHPPNAIVECLYAQDLADRRRYRDSLTHYDEALREDADFEEAHFGRAETLVELGEWPAVEKELDHPWRDHKYELPRSCSL